MQLNEQDGSFILAYMSMRTFLYSLSVVLLISPRVRGIKGLRVIDASIIPSAMSGDTYATQVRLIKLRCIGLGRYNGYHLEAQVS